MRLTRNAAATLISAALTGLYGTVQAQTSASGPDPEGFSSIRPGPSEGKPSDWTPAKVRQAQPVPLPEADPEAVKAAARRQR